MCLIRASTSLVRALISLIRAPISHLPGAGGVPGVGVRQRPVPGAFSPMRTLTHSIRAPSNLIRALTYSIRNLIRVLTYSIGRIRP